MVLFGLVLAVKLHKTADPLRRRDNFSPPLGLVREPPGGDCHDHHGDQLDPHIFTRGRRMPSPPHRRFQRMLCVLAEAASL